MENQFEVKYIVVDVDGEAILKFPVYRLPNQINFEMVEAIIASNPTLRFVDNAQIGGIWDGTRYVL